MIHDPQIAPSQSCLLLGGRHPPVAGQTCREQHGVAVGALAQGGRQGEREASDTYCDMVPSP